MADDSVQDLGIVVGVAKDRAKDPAGDRQGGVLDQGLGVHDPARTDSVAVGTGAVGGVEGEVARLQVIDGVTVLGAGQGQGVLEELALGALGGISVRQEVEAHAAFGQAGGGLHCLGYAAQAVLSDDHTVHDDLDGVLVLLVQLDLVAAQVHDLAIHADAAETLPRQVLEEFCVLALATQDHGRQNQGSLALTRLQDLVRHLVGGLSLDHAAALRAVGRAHTSKEKTQVVVDLRDRAHRGAGVPGGGLLVDGDCGRQAVDGVQVRLVHLTQEHAGVRREGLHVAALALGIDGVKGQAGLARAREARNHDQLVAGDGNVDVAQVVLARAADDDGF